MAGQQTALDASDDLLELHKAGEKRKIISIKIILGNFFMEILWPSAEFNLRLKHLRVGLYRQESTATFGV